MSRDPWPGWCFVHLQPGKKIRRSFGAGNINNALLHICAVVDADQIVFRTWSRRRQSWQYKIDHVSYFEMLYDRGILKGVSS